MALSKHLSEFCHKTSLKGVPRAAKADTVYFRFLWVIAVFSFSAVCVTQFCFLFLDYFSYPTNTRVYTEKSNTFVNSISPVHTVCNLRPSLQSGQDSEHYYQVVRNLTQCLNCSENSQLQRKRLSNLLLRPQGYYQYIGKELATEIGVDEEDMLLSCSIRVLTAGSYRNIPCAWRINVTKILHPSYYKCYRRQIPPAKFPHFLPHGISLDLFIDNFMDTSYKMFSPREEYTQSAGVILSIEDENTMPFTSPSHTLAAPGMHTDIRYRINEITSLPYPYGDCDAGTVIDLSQYPDFAWKGKIKKTQEACLILCNTYRIRDICGCTNVDASHGLVDATEKYPYCANASLGIEDLLKFEQCLYEDNVNIMVHCEKKCQAACHSVDFEQQVSIAKWPLHSFHNAFYKTYVTHGTLKYRFAVAEKLWSKNKTGCTDQCDQEDKNQWKATLIQSNFLKLSTHLYSLRKGIMQENPKYTMASVVSQLGGLLNLWCGLTVYFVIEILELGIRLGISWLSKGTNKTKVKEYNHGSNRN